MRKCNFVPYKDKWRCINDGCNRIQQRPSLASCPKSFVAIDSSKTLVNPPSPGGPGTELHKLLGRFGIKEKANCGCRKHTVQMDQNGPDWCEANMETILKWLKDESEKRKLPFVRTAAKILVKLAIHNARKKPKRTEED